MATSFWDQFAPMGPGLLATGAQTALNIYGQRQAARDEEERARRVRGPLYDQQIGLSGQALSSASGINPSRVAADEYQRYLDLTAEGDRADEEALMRRLVAQGQSGIASHGGVAGTKPTPGQPMNPQLAALYAARAGARERAAFDAQREGEARLDRQLNRAGMLQRDANSAVATRSSPEAQRVLAPQRPSTLQTVLSAGTKLLENPKIQEGLFSGLSKLTDSFADWFSGPFSAPVGGASLDWDF